MNPFALGLIASACWLAAFFSPHPQGWGDTDMIAPRGGEARAGGLENHDIIQLGFEIVGKLPPKTENSRSHYQSCPTDIETLTVRLLRDLPSYANRVFQRSRRIARSTSNTAVYVIVAGRAEFAPLTLGPGEYSSPELPANVEPPQQVFFTTLERQYTGGKVFEFQHYHWLFLTHSDSGWQLVQMYSRLGSYPASSPPTPPRESTNGVIGQAVRLWLRDCRAS